MALVTLLCGLSLTTVGPSSAAPQSGGLPSVTLDLHPTDGQNLPSPTSLTATGAGFGSGTLGTVNECAYQAPLNFDYCSDPLAGFMSNQTGGFQVVVNVSATFMARNEFDQLVPVDCAVTPCKVQAISNSGLIYAAHTMSFAAPIAGAGRYTPLTPARILDTRNGTGGISAKIGPGASADVQITGRGGVPASGVTAVAMNVTVTAPTAVGFLTLYPTGTTRPGTANLNFVPNQTVPNLAVVKVGTGGKVTLFNSAGSSHVIFDVAGWFSDAPTGNAGRYQPLTPARILDTRGGTRLGPGASLNLQVSGQGGVPGAGVGAAVLNVAVTGPTASSFLTLYPTGEARPTAANLNFVAGNTLSNRVIAKLGSGGRVTIFNNAGSTDVIVDVGGWFTDASVAGVPGAYTPLVPARILDTRNGTGGVSGPRAANSTTDVQITGRGGVPASGVSAVVFNATVTGPVAGGFLTIFPTGTARPLAADLNFATGETRANLVVVKLGTGGKASLFTSAGTHVIYDVAGWFS